MRSKYLDQRENTLFMGNPGTSKTHIATALGHAACAQGKHVRFHTVAALVAQLLEARDNRQLDGLFKRLDRYHLLIFDEFGYVPFSKTGAELFFEVLSRAYERQSVIITTNLPFENWTEVLGNERLTGALLDRLTHRVHIVDANGESYRLKNAKNRLTTYSNAYIMNSSGVSLLDRRRHSARTAHKGRIGGRGRMRKGICIRPERPQSAVCVWLRMGGTQELGQR